MKKFKAKTKKYAHSKQLTKCEGNSFGDQILQFTFRRFAPDNWNKVLKTVVEDYTFFEGEHVDCVKFMEQRYKALIKEGVI